jgi:hypothetical protein
MGFSSWADSHLRILRWYDISLMKISVMAFTLMLAKLWPAILSLDVEVYVLVFLLTGLVPLQRFLSNRRDV